MRLDREEDGVRILTLNVPEKRNAIDDNLRRDLRKTVLQVRDDAEARALVVTGAGSAFCAGADLPAVFGDSSRSVAQLRTDLRRVYDCFLVIQSLKIPTIAAVQGPAVGAGLNLAMACDFRIAGPKARFSAPFTRLGLHPGGGCTWFLVQAMGAQRTLKLLLEGGSVDGPESAEVGLALAVVDEPLAAAIDLARRCAALDPCLAADIKQAVETAVRHGLDATIEFETWAQASSATGSKIREAVLRMGR